MSKPSRGQHHARPTCLIYSPSAPKSPPTKVITERPRHSTKPLTFRRSKSSRHGGPLEQADVCFSFVKGLNKSAPNIDLEACSGPRRWNIDRVCCSTGYFTFLESWPTTKTVAQSAPNPLVKPRSFYFPVVCLIFREQTCVRARARPSQPKML